MSEVFTFHQHAAHCETGVMSTLLRNSGIEISEPMAFGLSSAINFAFLPFIKVSGQPLVAYRMPPRFIIRKLSKRLGIRLSTNTFGNPEKGKKKLDELLHARKLVGLQTSVYWLPYFPQEMRFHFNAHNLLIYGKEENDYLISDPVLSHTVRCDSENLQKARFARGTLAPKGYLYYIDSLPEKIDFPTKINQALKDTTKFVDGLPIPFTGTRGMEYLARKIDKLAESNKFGNNDVLFLGHIVRMQEEIGTGGAGFRYMYASFLQESADLMQSKTLHKISCNMTYSGDLLRIFAVNIVKYCKGRGNISVNEIANNLRECAESERAVIQSLHRYLKSQ